MIRLGYIKLGEVIKFSGMATKIKKLEVECVHYEGMCSWLSHGCVCPRKTTCELSNGRVFLIITTDEETHSVSLPWFIIDWRD